MNAPESVPPTAPPDPPVTAARYPSKRPVVGEGYTKPQSLHGAYHPNGHCPTGECSATAPKVRVWRSWPELYDIEPKLIRLRELGVPEDALQPIREWLKQQEAEQEAYHQRHLAHCGIKHLAAHGYGWGNCPNFVCPHCGTPPDADGDHSCPCPYRDEECPNHAV